MDKPKKDTINQRLSAALAKRGVHLSFRRGFHQRGEANVKARLLHDKLEEVRQLEEDGNA